jgi:hypothetical protein
MANNCAQVESRIIGDDGVFGGMVGIVPTRRVGLNDIEAG